MNPEQNPQQARWQSGYEPGAAAPGGPADGPAVPGSPAAPGSGPAAPPPAYLPPAGGPPGYVPPSPPPPPAETCTRRRLRPIELSLVAISMAILLVLAALLFALIAATTQLSGVVGGDGGAVQTPPAGSFSVVSVRGEIFDDGSDSLTSTAKYNHTGTIEYIRALADNPGDKGILLYMDTPGGGVYESDELYRTLAAYHEATGRPVWAYMASTCASGGVYACMAAQHITANYNTTTGSIGVYIALTDTSGLYEKLGIETVLVRSGPHKGTGTAGVPISEAERAVYQQSVDESYERFAGLVAAGRGLPLEKAKEIGDGRTYTATQALELGLVDELGDWDGALAAFEEETGATPFEPSFGGGTLSQLLGEVRALLPKSEAEAVLQRAEALPQGVPLAYAPQLAG